MFSELTMQGIIFVAFAWGTVSILLIFCMIKVLRGETNLEMAAKKTKMELSEDNIK